MCAPLAWLARSIPNVLTDYWVEQTGHNALLSVGLLPRREPMCAMMLASSMLSTPDVYVV
jgi:hypothetical protein